MVIKVWLYAFMTCWFFRTGCRLRMLPAVIMMMIADTVTASVSEKPFWLPSLDRPSPGEGDLWVLKPLAIMLLSKIPFGNSGRNRRKMTDEARPNGLERRGGRAIPTIVGTVF